MQMSRLMRREGWQNVSCAEGACLTAARQDGLGEECADAGAGGLGLRDGCRSRCGAVQVQAPAQQDGVI